MNASIFSFIFSMWVLMLVGGGLLVLLIAPLTGLGAGSTINSIIKVVIALVLIFFWVLILTKLKNWIFQKQLKS